MFAKDQAVVQKTLALHEAMIEAVQTAHSPITLPELLNADGEPEIEQDCCVEMQRQ